MMELIADRMAPYETSAGGKLKTSRIFKLMGKYTYKVHIIHDRKFGGWNGTYIQSDGQMEGRWKMFKVFQGRFLN